MMSLTNQPTTIQGNEVIPVSVRCPNCGSTTNHRSRKKGIVERIFLSAVLVHPFAVRTVTSVSSIGLSLKSSALHVLQKQARESSQNDFPISWLSLNSSFKACSPRNFMKAQCSNGPFPAPSLLFQFGCDCEQSSFDPGVRATLYRLPS